MQKVKLGDICSIQAGGTPSRLVSEFWENGNIPWVKISDLNKRYILTTEERITEKGLNNSSAKMFPNETILFSIFATLGETAILKIPAATNQAIAGLQLKDKNVFLNYLYYYLLSLKQYVNSVGRGVAQNNINLKMLRNFEIPLPPIEEQKEISERLDKVSELIEKRKEQIKKLDLLIKSRFLEMFGDITINDKKWERATIADYFFVKGGKRIPKRMSYCKGKTNHPYLRASDMKNATIIEDDIHYIDDNVFKYIKNYTINAGDIYLTNVGVNLGMAGVIPDKFDGASLTENAVKLVPKKTGIVNGVFLSYYINLPQIQYYINERKMTVGVPKLAIFRIETMPIILPPILLQNKFAEFVGKTDKLKQTIKSNLEKLETLKKSLMQQYFG